MGRWSGLCNLVPAVIVENISWSTLFLVGVLNVLTWIVFSSYLVSDTLLFPEFVLKVVEGVFCLVLLLFYTADIMLTGKLFWFFSSFFLVLFLYRVKMERKKKKKKKKKKEDIYINNCNNYNYDCNKQKPRTINVGVQCLISAEPASGTKSTFKPPPRQHIHNIQTDARTDRHTCIWRKSTFGSVKRCMSIWVLMPSNILINVCTSIQGLIIIMCFYMLTGLWGTIFITYSMPTQKGVIVFPMRLSFPLWFFGGYRFQEQEGASRYLV